MLNKYPNLSPSIDVPHVSLGTKQTGITAPLSNEALKNKAVAIGQNAAKEMGLAQDTFTPSSSVVQETAKKTKSLPKAAKIAIGVTTAIAALVGGIVLFNKNKEKSAQAHQA